MLEDAMGRLISGALWGLGAGLVLTVTRGGGEGLRSVAKGTVRGALGVGDWLRNVTAEGRETLQDVYAEARAEVDAERATPAT